ncbi:MAG: hypothetical protein JNM11_00305 [Chitinimonas sp.]|nr:hypothetical protein [Chitinimonas sp.]
MEFAIRQWLPPGTQGIAQLADTPGRWRPLWLRWLSWRSEDARFASFLDDLESWLVQEPPRDWQKRLDNHLGHFRNRYFLFLCWADGCSANPRSDAELPDISWLGDIPRHDLLRWRRQQVLDQLALKTTLDWHQQAGLGQALTYRGVNLAPAYDYYLLPDLLKEHYRAFKETAHD